MAAQSPEEEGDLLPDTDSEKYESSSDKETKFLYISCFILAFGFFTIGYDLGIVSGSMIFITEKFSLTFLWHELLVSMVIGPAVVGSLFAGYSNEVLGRKLTLLMSALVISVGALVMACANSKNMLLLGRVLTGIAFGFTSMTSNLYIAEFAPARIRGKLSCFCSVIVTGSMFSAALVSGIFSGDKTNGWRYMLGLGAVPSLVLFVGVLFVPESPRWLISKGRVKEATKVLQKLRGTADVEEEIHEIKHRHKLAKKEGNSWSIMFRIMSTSHTRRALLLGCGLMAIQQLSGINTIAYYAATIIKMSGVKDESVAVWLASTVAFTNFVFTFVALFTVDRFGRRKLVLSSIIGVFLSLVLLAITFYIEAQTSPLLVGTLQRNSSSSHRCFTMNSCDDCLYDEMCGFCYDKSGGSIQNASCVPLDSYSSTRTHYCKKDFELIRYYGCPSSPTVYTLTVIGLVLYFISFAPGLGPVPFVVSAEIFPLWARSTGMALAVCIGFFFNLIMSMTFLHGSRLFTKAGWFGLTAVFSLLGWIFLYFLLPETKGRRLEHMEDLFSNTKTRDKT